MVSPAKAGSWTYPQELVLAVRDDGAGRIVLKKDHRFPNEGEKFSAGIPEEGPDDP
jgi:hypothetical protein